VTRPLNNDGAFIRQEQQPGYVPMNDLGLEPTDLVQYDAYHEAGHAVLALVQGIPITRVTMPATVP
jgi:hypothetical protein